MVSTATRDFPLLARVKVLGHYCLAEHVPHVLLALDAFLDDFSFGVKAGEAYERTGSLRFMQYVAARESVDAIDPFYGRSLFNRTVRAAAAKGDLEAVQWLLESYLPSEQPTEVVTAAAANGHLHILQWLFDNHRDKGYWGCTEMCGALQNKHTEVIAWLQQHAVPRESSLKKVIEAAAAAGNTDMVKWLHTECHANVEDALWSAQKNSQWETAQWILENYNIIGPWIDWDLPAKDGSLSFLKFLRSRSMRGPGFYTLQAAAWNGHVEIVDWLVRELRVPVSPTVWYAAHYGHLKVVQWLHDNEYRHGRAAVMDSAAVNGHFEVVKWLHENWTEGCSKEAMDGAAMNGYLDVVQWLHENRPEGCTSGAMDAAAREGHLDVVKWLHKNSTAGCTTEAMNEAAENGHLEVVQWLHANRSEGCTTCAMDMASCKGHLDTVKWLHEYRNEGCTSKAMDMAAMNGHLDVVKWLHANRDEGCTVEAMNKAAANGHLHVVQWLHENRKEGCTIAAMTQAILGAHFEVALFLHEHRAEGFKFHRNTIIKLPMELMQWLIANFVDKLHGCEFEVELSDWCYNEWCHKVNLRMAHRNEDSVWWECDAQSVRTEVP